MTDDLHAIWVTTFVGLGLVGWQELETLLWTLCRLEHRADDFVSDMAVEVSANRFEGGMYFMHLLFRVFLILFKLLFIWLYVETCSAQLSRVQH